MGFIQNLVAKSQAQQAQFQNAPWYPAFQKAYNSGDPNQVIAFAQSVAPQYPDFVNNPAAQNFVGTTVQGMQSGQSHNFGDTLGNIAGGAAKVGLGAGALYLGGAGLGLLGEGALAGDAALAGGGEVGSGYAASAPGAAATTAATGTAAATGAATGAAPMGDWWSELGLTPTDVGMDSTPFTTNPSYADLGGNIGSSAAGSSYTDLLKQYGPALARLAPGLLGAYASNKQAGALQNLAGQYQNYGGPSRARFEASMAPGFDPTSIPGYSGALDTASKSILAKLSATGGNPYGNPGGLIDANKQIVAGTALPAIQAYQNQNANVGFGGTLNAAGSFGGQAIGANANIYNALGAGINDAVNPPQTLEQQLAAIKKSGIYSPNGLS